MHFTDDSQYLPALPLHALDGLSVGDAFGEGFFTGQDALEAMLETRLAAAPVWRYTDDTLTALSVMAVLRQFGAIEQNVLATGFAQRYESERGYGPAMQRLLAAI